MKWRVRFDLAFENEKTARKVWKAVREAKDKAVVIKPGKPEEERPHGDIHECHHDQTPSKPCKIIEEFK